MVFVSQKAVIKSDFWGIETSEALRTDAPPPGDVSASRKRTA